MNYNAKLLLFGEHTIIKGSQALAMPLRNYFGTWDYAVNPIQRESLQQQLPELLVYLYDNDFDAVLNLACFSKQLDKGLYFNSSIPKGYGLGSSGALCAAIYDRYKRKEVADLGQLQLTLSLMENFFHGKSSGIDPLVCYLNHAVLFSKNEKIRKATLAYEEARKGALFLINTHIPRKTAPLVEGFLERCQHQAYLKQCMEVLIPSVHNAIYSLLKNDWISLHHFFTEISHFQFDFFDFMIPDDFKTIWKRGLETEHFKCKICGAGGGGFLLCISKDFNDTKKQLRGYELLRIL